MRPSADPRTDELVDLNVSSNVNLNVLATVWEARLKQPVSHASAQIAGGLMRNSSVRIPR